MALRLAAGSPSAQIREQAKGLAVSAAREARVAHAPHAATSGRGQQGTDGGDVVLHVLGRIVNVGVAAVHLQAYGTSFRVQGLGFKFCRRCCS